MEKTLLRVVREKALPSVVILALLLFSFVSIVFADNVTTQVAVGNATPSVSGTVLAGGTAITLTENTTTNVVATTTVTDANSCSTITGVSANLFLTSVGSASCDESGESNANNCYPVVSCTVVGGTCGGGADTTADYTCGFDLAYYVEPGEWTISVTASDGTASSTADTDTETVNTTTALDVTTTINYGTLAANSDTGTSNSTTTVTNTGNGVMDPQISGTDLTDSTTPITVDNQEYSLTNFTYGTGTDLSGIATTVDMNLPKRTTTEITDDLYWGISVPAGTEPGTYTGTNTFTAVVGS